MHGHTNIKFPVGQGTRVALSYLRQAAIASLSVRELEVALSYLRQAAIAVSPLTLQCGLLPHVVSLPIFCIAFQHWLSLFLVGRHRSYFHTVSYFYYYIIFFTGTIPIYLTTLS
jgi:hypothetical protein